MHSLASENSQSWLTWFLRGILVLLFLVLFAKLFETQIIKGSYFKNLSQENRIRKVEIPAPRGKILAKGGEVLAGNIQIKKKIEFTASGGFALTDISSGENAEDTVSDYTRYYPMGEKLSHALGYLSKVGDDEVGKINPGCPQKGPRSPTSLIGKTGLEEAYECTLSGIPGEEIIEVDATGKTVRILGKKDPVPGKDIQTTIDYGLQTEVANQMSGKKGAAIVTSPDGSILAFYSYPGFDPNVFVSEKGRESIGDLLTSEDLPFFNRVIGGTFHPGSVFKPLVAIAALESGAIDRNFVYSDTGVIKVGDYSYSNWYFTEYGRTEGPIGLTKAIARSTDTFFYTIGQLTGPEKIAEWADTFGLNAQTGIDIGGEVKGLIPTPEWKKKVKNETWFLGNTYHMSIGQGDVSLTPIEVNSYISAIADNGKLCTPHFVNVQPGVFGCKQIKVKQNNLDLVKEGMAGACSTGGTAYTFFDFPQKHGGVQVDCKTGTAEVGTDGTPHAWFTFFAPADNPQIVGTILVEKGGEGASVAGPVARKIADYYFQSFGQTISSETK